MSDLSGLSGFEDALLRLADVLAGLDPSRIRDGISELAVRLCDGEFALLVGADDDARTGTWAGERPSAPPAVWRAPLLAAAFRDRQPLRIDDVGRWARSESALAQYGTAVGGGLVRSYLVVPACGRDGEVVAALFVGHRRAHAFGEHHERLAGALARFLATALENAARFEEQSRVAGALQETLLPPLLPAIAGVDLGARYRTSTVGGGEVGGDFYDVFRAGDRWAAVIGDVCGTGPEAAAVTGIARYTVRALAGAPASGPAATLVALNDGLVHATQERRFLTAVLLLFTVSSSTGGGVDVCLARAGHPPPAVLRSDGSVAYLEEPKGTLLGVFDEAVVDEAPLHLAPGDALVLYTDGVVEARDATREQFGYGRLASMLSTCAGRTADGIARRVELAVADFIGPDGDAGGDDAAILVLRAT